MQGPELTKLRGSMTQQALADAIGMSRKSIVEMEKGRAPIEERTELAVRYVVERLQRSGIMSERIERAVEAVEKILVDHIDPLSDSLSGYGVAMKVVPAVLAAICEPNEAMIDAALGERA